MKILMATDEYFPLVGGLEYSIEIMACELRQLGHEVAILAPEFPNLPPEESTFRLRSLPSMFGRGDRFSIPFPRKMMKTLKNTDWDIIHIHTPYHIGHISYSIAKKMNVACVYTCHSLQEHFTHGIPVLPQSLLKWGARFWNRRFCNRADGVIAPSEDIKNILLQQGITAPIFSLKTPIDGKWFDPIRKVSPYQEQLGFLPNEKICLYVGQIAKEKNLQFLIDSFKLVQEAVNNSRLVLIGDGPYRAELQKYINHLGLTQSVMIMGYLPRRELSTWYSHATLFLFPSMIETQGMVVPEALYFGLPAIIVDGTGTRGVVQSGVNGFVIQPNKHLYAQSVIRALDNLELRKRLAANAQSQALTETHHVIESLLEIYTELTTHV